MAKSIKGYEGLYEIDENGVIRRLGGETSDGKRVHEHVVNASKTINHMRYVALRKDGMRKTYLLHKIYAQAFQISENEAIRRLYRGFTGRPSAKENVERMLIDNLLACKRAQEQGEDRHDEILYIMEFLAEMKNDTVCGFR